MSKKKFVKKTSNDIIKEKYKEGYTDKKLFKYIKSLEPKNDIEKKIVQRMACIVGGSIKLKKEKFENKKFVNLLSFLKK